MKKFIPILFAFLFVFSSCSYEPGVSEAFAKYRFKDGVVNVTVPGWVIGLAAKMGDLEESEKELLDCIDKVRVLAVDDDNLNAKINLHEEFYEQVNKKGNFEELLIVREEGEEVTVFGKMDDSVIKEMLVLVGGEDNAMIYIKGELTPEMLNEHLDLRKPDKFLSLNF